MSFESNNNVLTEDAKGKRSLVLMKKRYLISLILIVAMAVSTAIAFGAVTTTSKYTGSKINHNSMFDNMLIVDGVDVSAWQENIDWEKAKADGIDFAIIRIAGRGYGKEGNMYADSQYAKHIKGAREAGIMVGIYFFSQAVNEEEAVEEANETLKYLKGEELDLPIFMDYEFAGGASGRLTAAKLSKAQMTKNAEAFCDTVEAAGYDAGFYANYTFLTKTVDGKALSSKYTVWAAQYYNKCEYQHKYDIWQYSSSGKVAGINGRADVDVWYVDTEPKASSANSIADSEVSFMTASSYLYNSGKPIKPEISVEHNGKKLVKGTDYKVSYIKNTALGTGYVFIQGKGGYTDYKLVPFSIVNELPEDIGIHGNVDIKSEKYKFGDYVTGVDLGTSVKDFNGKIALGSGLSSKLTNAAGKEVTSGNVGTGMKLSVTDAEGNVIGTAPIVIKGDCDGDGVCGLSDLLKIRKQIMSIEKFGGAQFKGLDANGDNSVGLADLLAFRKHIMGIAAIKN